MMELMHTCFECDGFCEHEVSIFDPVPGRPAVYFSKQPSDIKRIKPLLDADPDLFSVCMIRDPRSVITSMHNNLPGIYFCNFRIWNECYQAAKKLTKHPRCLILRYEDLANDPETVQSVIETKFPWLIKKHGFSEYHRIANPSGNAMAALGGVRKISPERVRTWMKHLPRIKYEYEQHPEMADILTELDYEPDQTWLKPLKSVNPKKGECRYPDHPSPLKRLEYFIRVTKKTVKYKHQIRKKRPKKEG
jgi:hypothetical protein